MAGEVAGVGVQKASRHTDPSDLLLVGILDGRPLGSAPLWNPCLLGGPWSQEDRKTYRSDMGCKARDGAWYV